MNCSLNELKEVNEIWMLCLWSVFGIMFLKLFSKCVCVFTDLWIQRWLWFILYIKRFSVVASWHEVGKCQFFFSFFECVVHVWGCVVYYSSCKFSNQNWYYWYVDIITGFSVFSASTSLMRPSYNWSASKKGPIISTVALLNIFLGMNLSQKNRGSNSPSFFLPISTTFSSSDGQCQGCV